MSQSAERIEPDSRHDRLLCSPIAAWQRIETTDRDNVYVMRFAEHQIGNPFIRAIHGGVVGSLIELAAELYLARREEKEDQAFRRVELVSSAIDYLRVTKDADMHARVETVRIARRVAFLDIWCWQDSEDLPVARGSCTLRIFKDE